MLKHKGILKFDPRALSNADALFKSWWCVILSNDDIGNYYSWFVERRYGLKLQRPAFGPHISLIRGEETTQENWDYFKNKYNNTNIEYYIDISKNYIYSN
ncbi:MAG TPA: hypothetical protein P5509_07445, partial [Bacteroidales bacterium]|nr:hypothetical protein [Bacteroidales bacterium]